MKLKLAYLYPKLLNNYGNNGNILAIKKRCEWRNIEFIIDEINIGDTLSEHDFYYIGDGEGIPLIRASEELKKQQEFFIKERDNMAVFMGVCGGFSILGNSFQQNEKTIDGLGIIDTYSETNSKRHSGNVTIESEFITPNTIVGFENNIYKTYLGENTTKLGNVIIGYGNNGEDKTEGARYKNVFGTNISGPILPKNPVFTDYLIELAIGSKPEPINDDLETITHNSLIKRNY